MRLARMLVLLCVVTPVTAQVPGMFPWWDSPIAGDLGLSEEQRNRIRATVGEWRERLDALRREAEDAEAHLRREMDAEFVDPGRAEAAIEGVVTVRARLTRAVSQMSLQLRLVLTSEQWQRLQERESRGPGRRPGMGPGPPGPNLPRPPRRPPDGWPE